jgi:hypothetical protein
VKLTSYIWQGTGSPNAGGLNTAKNPNWVAALAIGTGKRKVVRIPVGDGEAWLHRIYVKQASGTAAAFTVRLVTSTLPYGDQVADASLAAYNAATGGNPDVFEACTVQGAGPGGVVDYRPVNGDAGEGFSNVDGPNSARGQAVYLVIIPVASADPSTWEVALVLAKEAD